MKKYMFALVLFLSFAILLANSLAEPIETTYNAIVYEDDTLSITCHRITGDFIEFYVTSHLKNNNISVYLDRVALDGVIPEEYYGGNDNWLSIEPQQTVTMHYYAHLNQTDHRTMSMCFDVFNNKGNGTEYSIANFDMGGNYNPESIFAQQGLLYDSSTLSIDYGGGNDTGLVLFVTNKDNASITFSIDTPFSINGKEYSETISVRAFPPFSCGTYEIPLSDFEYDYVPESIESFTLSGYTYSHGNTIDNFTLDSEKEHPSSETTLPSLTLPTNTMPDSSEVADDEKEEVNTQTDNMPVISGPLCEQDFYYEDNDTRINFTEENYDTRSACFDKIGDIIPDDSDNGFRTARGIHILDSINDVHDKYGAACLFPFLGKRDPIYDAMTDWKVSFVGVLDRCIRYSVYTWNDRYQLAFYFDKDDELIWVCYINGIAYKNYALTELKRGNKGESVRQLQTALNNLGYYTSSIDGDFGKGTAKAVEDFEKKNGLTVTGIASIELQSLLYSTSAVGYNERQYDEANTDEVLSSYDAFNSPSLPNTVYDTYTEVTDLTIDDLTVKDMNFVKTYFYKDFSLVPEDVEWVESPRNIKRTVEDGAVYRKIAYSLQGFEMGIQNGSALAESLLGIKTSTREEFMPYWEQLSMYFVRDDSLLAIMKAFSSLHSVEGNFDFTNNEYSFSVPNLHACAAEMGITEEMLGYIFAMLNEYAPSIEFDGNHCTFNYSKIS